MSPDGQDSPTAVDSYGALLRRLQHRHVPFTVLWELTHRCNLRCVMCYNTPSSAAELSTAEAYDVLEQLARAGTLRLVFTGGEILTRPDFFRIARRARALGFLLYLKTNGQRVTPRVADDIAALDPLRVDISLLGASETTLDRIMGGRNTLPRILRAVRLLQERGVAVQLNTLLVGLNLAEQQAMTELASGLGVADYQQSLRVSSADDGCSAAMALQLSVPEMVHAMRHGETALTREDWAADHRTCAVGLTSSTISPTGIVYPCVQLRIPAGDLRLHPFVEVWENAPILRELRERHTAAYLGKCRACPINGYCKGRCSGLAWKETGNLYSSHLTACQQAQAAFALANPGSSIQQLPAVFMPAPVIHPEERWTTT